MQSSEIELKFPISDPAVLQHRLPQLGFHLDVDHRAGEQFRVVQLTPPGSACSISFGIGICDATPGAVRGTHLVVTDIEQARADWLAQRFPKVPGDEDEFIPLPA